MNGFEILNNLKKLKDISKIKDVEPLSNALFPGYHCPLMGALLTIKEIKDAVLLVLGPDECTYYSKMATGIAGSVRVPGTIDTTNSIAGNIVSVVLDGHDVTFGCKEKLDEAFAELIEERKPKTVFIITTCIIEVTGDDIDSIAELLKDKYNINVEVIHAENFKTDDHLPGIQDSMSACIGLMQPQICDESINILGQRLGDFKQTEVFKILTNLGIKKGLQLPGECDLEEIRQAPKAKVNLVVHPIGLPLAKKMKTLFGTPYVIFERYSKPENILEAYEDLFKILGKDIPPVIQELFIYCKQQEENIKKLVNGLTYYCGNSALSNFELNSYLLDLGLKPLLIQVSDIPNKKDRFLKEVLDKSNPYITRSANIGPLRYLYNILTPDFNIGVGNSMILKKNKIAPVSLTNSYNILGFEVNTMILNSLIKSKEILIKLKGE